jgi:hypothetical protein
MEELIANCRPAIRYSKVFRLWEDVELRAFDGNVLSRTVAPKIQTLTSEWLVAGFPSRLPGFDPESGQVGFVVDKAALGRVFSEYFGLPIFIPPNSPSS